MNIMTTLMGQTLKNRYRVEESLGRGGMAEVYRVWDEDRSVYIAMKVLRQDIAQDPVFLRRFQREAHSLAKLQHPNIVRFYGLEREGLLAFLLMEYVAGQSLQAEILLAEGKPLPNARILEVLQPVCSALSYAHKMNLVHCDLKPGNILIEKGGRVLLTDFGIARTMDSATSTLVGAGTPAYMAPELIMGKDPTPQSDIYSLGIVLYEMFTGGERPFVGERAGITGTTAEKVRWEHLNLEPPSVKTYNPQVPKGVDALIARCLTKDPQQRFTGALEIFRAFTQLLKIETQSEYTWTSYSSDSKKKEGERIGQDSGLKGFGNEFPSGRKKSDQPATYGEVGQEKPKTAKTEGISAKANPDEVLSKNHKRMDKKGSITKDPMTYLGLVFGLLFLVSFWLLSSYFRNTREHKTYTQLTQSARDTSTAYNSLSATKDNRKELISEIEENAKEIHLHVDSQNFNLIESDDNDQMSCKYISTGGKDFVLQADFKNPYNTTNGWDYGIVFGSNDGNALYQIVISDPNKWDFYYRLKEEMRIISGTSKVIKSAKNSVNRIKLIAAENKSFLFINDEFITEINLNDQINFYKAICTDLYNSNGTDENVINVKNVRLWTIN